MKVYYFDNVEGDQRLPHSDESLPPADQNTLERIGVSYWSIPIDLDGKWQQVCRSPGWAAEGLNRLAKGNRPNCPTTFLQKSGRDQCLESRSRRCLRVKNQNLLRGVSLRTDSSLSQYSRSTIPGICMKTKKYATSLTEPDILTFGVRGPWRNHPHRILIKIQRLHPMLGSVSGSSKAISLFYRLASIIASPWMKVTISKPCGYSRYSYPQILFMAKTEAVCHRKSQSGSRITDPRPQISTRTA